MTTSYLPYVPEQQHLLPQALQDWLPEGHLAYYIHDTVDCLDLSAFHARYAFGGPRNQPFHPAMMVKVLLYGYATGVFSSRKIARKLHEDIAFRVLAAGNAPAHRTISDFRALHLNELGALFVQIVKLAGECGLVKLGTIAIDGTKIKANASRHKAMSYERMQQTERELRAQIDQLLSRAHAADEAERDDPELDIPAEIARREVRLAAIEAAKARLEARQQEIDRSRGRTPDDQRRPRDGDGNLKKAGASFKRDFGVPEPGAQDNFTDPESRLMKRSGGGFDYAYNAQLAVDEEAHIIVAAELIDCAADNRQLPAMLDAVHRNTGGEAATVLADAGYRSEAVFAELDTTTKSDVIVALGREGKQQLETDKTKHPHQARMAAKFESSQTRAAYRKRKWIAEPPNGWVKNILGFRQFSLRGLCKAGAEWKLICAALNLKRMAVMAAT